MWWTARGERFGFELVFFRQGERHEPSDNPRLGRCSDLYLAHAALTDIDGKRFWYRERLNRAGPGIAGASFDRAAGLERKLVGAVEWRASDARCA